MRIRSSARREAETRSQLAALRDGTHPIFRPHCCDVCTRTDAHIHCPECGGTDHVASECEMMG